MASRLLGVQSIPEPNVDLMNTEMSFVKWWSFEQSLIDIGEKIYIQTALTFGSIKPYLLYPVRRSYILVSDRFLCHLSPSSHRTVSATHRPYDVVWKPTHTSPYIAATRPILKTHHLQAQKCRWNSSPNTGASVPIRLLKFMINNRS